MDRKPEVGVKKIVVVSDDNTGTVLELLLWPDGYVELEMKKKNDWAPRRVVLSNINSLRTALRILQDDPGC